MLLAAALMAATAWSTPVSGSAGEVVGATGRIGSLLLRAGKGSLAAVPRGLAPGSLSPAGTPIIVAVHASMLEPVLRATPVHRLPDLCLLCNGIVRESVAEVYGTEAAAGITIGCVYFGVPTPGAEPSAGGEGVPPTTLAGTHANAVAALIESEGPRCVVLPTLEAIGEVAELKMLWASTMWLLCAHHSCAVGEVHAAHDSDLRSLVSELLRECPSVDRDIEMALRHLKAYSLSMPHVVPSEAMARAELASRNGWFLRRAALAGRAQPVHQALLRTTGFSARAIEAATSKPQAVAAAQAGTRWEHAPSGMSFHVRPEGPRSRAPLGPGRQAVCSVVIVGAGILGSALALELVNLGMRVHVVDRRSQPPPPDAAAVDTPASPATEGPSAIDAPNSTRPTTRRKPSPMRPGASRASRERCTDATSGSWAWLNANGKDGRYGALNRLSMAMWRRQSVYSELALWCGSLVCTFRSRADDAGGAYAAVADLTDAAVCEAEPALRMPSSDSVPSGGSVRSSDSVPTQGAFAHPGSACEEALPAPERRRHFHGYPDEGFADPREAAAALQAAAAAAGATFHWELSVEGLLRDGGGAPATDTPAANAPATGVRARRSGVAGQTAEGEEARDFHADVVVLAAGLDIGGDALGGAVPMQHSPGRLAHTVPCDDALAVDPRAGGAALTSVFVDTTSGSHCLMRRDGSCAIGGDLSGYGTVTTTPTTDASPGNALAPCDADDAAAEGEVDPGDASESDDIGQELMRRAAKWLPFLHGHRLKTTTMAHRVIPADGLPAIGWSSRTGAYVLAAHSGITLAPALSALAAAEIVHGHDMELIEEAWRPDRFLST